METFFKESCVLISDSILSAPVLIIDSKLLFKGCYNLLSVSELLKRGFFIVRIRDLYFLMKTEILRCCMVPGLGI